MIYRRSSRKTLSEAQSCSQTMRHGSLYSTVGFVHRLADGDVKHHKCQWINGEPTKAEYREHGVDNFKCLEPTVPGKPYCEPHCSRCYVKPALTEPA